MRTKTTTHIKVPKRLAQWFLVDGSGKTAGRLASCLAHLLLGKGRADFSPQWTSPVWVIVINAEKVSFSKDKLEKKIYFRHSGYPGGLKKKLLGEKMAGNPAGVLQNMVKEMLPRNALRRTLLSHLKIYEGDKHPHGGQEPQLLEVC